MAASREQQFQATPSCCVACWPLTQSWKSDLKRQLIGFISYALKGESAPEFRLPTVGLPRPSPSGRLLSEAQEIEYNFLLAKLREAEGCSPDTLIAERDLLAATKLGYLQPMYEKTEATKNMIFLEAARCIDIWYQKGLKLEQKYYGPEHDQVREGEAAWAKIWSQIHCLQVLRLSVSLSILRSTL